MEFDALRETLNRIEPLPAALWMEVQALVRSRTIAAGEHLLRAGAPATRVFFLRRGLLREYYVDSAGQESTRRFCRAGEFSGSLADLLKHGPALVSIESIEAGEVWE